MMVRETNGIGTAGFILALLGILLIWLPFINFILWGLGLLFSIIGLFKKPKGLAIAGFVISMISIVISIVFFAGALLFLGNLIDNSTIEYNQTENIYYDPQNEASEIEEAEFFDEGEVQEDETHDAIDSEGEFDGTQETEEDSSSINDH